MFGRFKRWLKAENSRPLGVNPQWITLHGHQYSLRRATNHDIPAMIEIERQNFGTPPWSANAFEVELSRGRDRLYLVVVYDSQVVGYAGSSFNWYHRESHITNIAVLPAYHSQGIGECLIKTLFQVSVTVGMVIMSLEVRASNIRAQQLYQRLGFRQSKLKRHYYIDDHEDALEMKVTLRSEEEDK